MIQISAQRFNNEFRASQDLGYLLSCIGEKVIIETDFYYEDITWATADNVITLKPNAYDVDLTDSTGVIYSEDGQAFKDYQIGDSIGVYSGAFNYYTVTEKINDGLIRTTYGGALLTLTSNTHYVFNATFIAGVRYAWNLIDSGNDFTSLIDGEFQQAEISTASPTNTSYQTMSFKGILSYQIGTIEIKGIAGSGGSGTNYTKQSFTIKHTTWITPLFLFSQYDDLYSRIAPDYFFGANCLNYVARIEFNKALSNPNGFKTIDIPYQVSNIGWFNEKFNGSKTNYSISSVVYKDGATVINSLQFDKDITVIITLRNNVDSPFRSTLTKVVFGINYLPESESFYQNNGYNQTTNFILDTYMMTMDVVSGNGHNYGTTMQVIKTTNVDWVTNYECKITAIIRVGTAAKAIFQQGDYSRFAIWAIVEDHSLSANVSDKVNLLADVNEFEVILSESDLIDNETIFIQHPYESTDTGAYLTTINMFPVDDVVVQSDFSIDFTGRTTDNIILNKIRSRIILQHATESDIILEDFQTNVSGYNFIDGYIQDIDFSQDKSFKVPDGIRKTVTIQRNYDLDSGLVKYWRVNYPFMNRWEYWAALNVSNPPSGIFDTTEKLNGLNHFWNRLANVSGWSLVYELNIELEQNGDEFEQTFTTQIYSNDFDSGDEWGNQSIKSYEPTGVTELLSGGNKYITGYQDVRIKASFEKLSGLIPASANDVVITIWIEIFEAGGISDIRLISSSHVFDSQSWFKSIDGNDLVKITKSGSTFIGECYVDYSKIPDTSKFTIYARIYDNSGGCLATAIQDEFGFCLQDEDGVDIEED